MKTITLSFHLFTKRIVLNIILFIQVIMSFYLLMPIVSNLYQSMYAEKVLENMDMNNLYYMYVMDSDEDFQAVVRSRLEKLDYIKEVGEIYNYYDASNDISILGYSNGLISLFTPSLIKGGWFQENLMSDKSIPAVVTKSMSHNIGDIFTTSFDIDGAPTSINCMVIGIINSPKDYISMMGGAPQGFFIPDRILGNDPRTIILPADKLPIGENNYPQTPGKLLMTQDTANYETVQNDLGWFGDINDMQYGNNIKCEQTYQYSYLYATLIITFISLTVLAIFSSNIMQIASNKKVFGIYYLLGMSYKKGMIVEIIRVLILIMCCMGGIGTIIVSTDFLEFYFNIEQLPTIFIAVFAYLLIAFIPSSLGFYLKNSKEEINQLIKP